MASSDPHAIDHREVILDAILMPDPTAEGAAVRNAGRAALDALLAENEKLRAALGEAFEEIEGRDEKGERIAYTCPGHSFYVLTFAREYDTPAGTFNGFETVGIAIDEDGRPKDWLYSYHAKSERKARHAHFVIARRLSRLHPAEVAA